MVGRHGRNHELELLVRYLLRKGPLRLLAMAPLGLRLIRAGRWRWFPKGSRTGRGCGGSGPGRADGGRLLRESTAPAGTVGYGVVAERARSPSQGAGLELRLLPGLLASRRGRPYDRSLRRVMAALGLELGEIPDWNCCGATSTCR